MTGTHFLRWRCSLCGRTHERDAVRHLCPACSDGAPADEPLRGVLLAEFDGDAIRARFRHEAPDWSLFSAVPREYWPDYPVGGTPFHAAPRLGGALGLGRLRIKNDSLNPSGSLKDRASHLVVAEAARLGEHVVVTASTGNAASALAAVCAAAGRQALILVPASAPRAKLVQMLLHGARVVPVDGSYDDAFRLSLAYTAEAGGLNRNTAYHPLTIEGKKTVGLEIWADNGFRVPDVILVPTGDGVIISSVHKAFHDLRDAGLTDRLPRLVAVQAAGSDAIHRAITTGGFGPSRAPSTIADSISVRVPSGGLPAVNAVRESGGCSVTVSDREIMDAQRRLASLAGVFAEPAAAATAAALPGLLDSGAVDPDEQIVLLITGNGLKDIDAAQRSITIPDAVPAHLDAVRAWLDAHPST